MRLTQWTDFSLRVLMYCAASEQREQRATVGEIAEAHGISRSHLTKIVMTLSGLGLLETTRGRGGGLRLLKPAQGIVVGDFEGPAGTLRGFHLQSLLPDDDPATSEGVFVFNGSGNNVVALGQVVRVTGAVSEFQGQTQISATDSAIVACGGGSVEPTDLLLPFPDAGFAERYEGMLVRLPQTLHVTEHFQLGRFGQVVLSVDGRQAQPTNVVAPGTAALALEASNQLGRIILDDTLQTQNPDPIVFGRGGMPLSAANTLRGGDNASGIVGVMTWTWAGNAASGPAPPEGRGNRRETCCSRRPTGRGGVR